MFSFLQQHASKVLGVLNGFDRLRLRGTFRGFSDVRGMKNLLSRLSVLLKDFTGYAKSVTDQMRHFLEQDAQSRGRPWLYLPSSSLRKETLAKQIASKDGIRQGLICMFSCVEPCWTFRVHPDRATKHLVLRAERSKCLHYYQYWYDSMFGFLHVRLQMWFPFSIMICINGREWLARQLDAARIGYVRKDNCFVHLDDFRAAQQHLDRQLRVNWPKHLDHLADRIHPGRHTLIPGAVPQRYWSAEESEWASDLLFSTPQALADLYPHLILHGITHFGSPDVMRFLGNKTPTRSGVHHRFTGEIISDLKTRPEGMRIKHSLNGNFVKMYDKQGQVLRVETVINRSRDFKVYRSKEGDPKGPKSWQRLRKGVADLHRRSQISQKCNERYLEKLAAVDPKCSLAEVSQSLCQPTRWCGKRMRALNPLAQEEVSLLTAVSRGEYSLTGFRNRDLQKHLYANQPVDLQEKKKRMHAVTRKLALLRAHGLVCKVSRTHRYQLTSKGTLAISAVLTARAATLEKLNSAA